MITAPKNAQSDNKLPVHVLPLDLFVKYLVPAYQEGFVKYFRESWRLGFSISDMLAAAIRHLEQFGWQGEDYDQDTEKLYDQKEKEDAEFKRPPSKHHLAAVIFSCLCMLQTLENRPELDDRICTLLHLKGVD